jgi:hypothetical protein
VFFEIKTGQIVARLLRGEMDEIPILESNLLFDSKIHNKPVNLPKFKVFLAEMIPNECLEEIWKDPETTFFLK